MTTIPFAAACERNKRPILDVLQRVLPARGRILEIGSGTGQHLVYFARHFPGLQWQPSDCPEYLEGLCARIRLEGGDNTLPPLELDVLGPWPETLFDAAYSANTSHIMGWDAVCAMFAGLEFCLSPGALFCLYGPFNQGGKFTAPSNEVFDRQLRERCPKMGLRDLDSIELLAERHHMRLEGKFPMPANNQLLVFRRNNESKSR